MNAPDTDPTDPTDPTEAADQASGEPDAGDAVGEGEHRPAPGRDTATGTDPDAKYEHPGYEDKSFGQAVNQDQDLVDQLVQETNSGAEAEKRFEQESAGAPTLRRQNDGAADDVG